MPPRNVLAQPATAYIAGQQAGQQQRLTESAGQRAQQGFDTQQRAAKTTIDFNEEKLRQLKEAGGFKKVKENARADATKLNAILQLPESQQQAGFEQVAPTLSTKVTESFVDENGALVFNPQRATLWRNLAIEFEKADPSALEQQLQFAFPGDTEKQREAARKIIEKKGKSGKGITLTTAAGDVLQVGGDETMKLDKPTARTQQKQLIDSENAIASIKSIRDRYKPDFFTYKGAGKGAISHQMGKLGIEKGKELKQFANERKFIFNEIGQMFNAYRKEITGAAASVGELKMLKDTFINTDLDPDEFLAALDQYEEKVLRGQRIARKLLREGVKVGSKEFGTAHDKAWVSGGDDNIDTRGDELESQGMTEEQVIQRLKDEGYY